MVKDLQKTGECKHFADMAQAMNRQGAGIKVFRQFKAVGSKEELLVGVYALLEFFNKP